MRNLLAPARYALAATFVATGLLAPALVQAAPGRVTPAALAHLAISGSVVAAPQPTVPTSLFIQVGSQTISVSITSHTRLYRRFNSTSSLSEFSDGDTVEVNGSANEDGGITAYSIVNSSVQIENTDLQGNVVSITPAGTVPSTVVVNNLSALDGSDAPFPNPLPAQMNLPLSTASTITINGNTTSASNAIGQVKVSDQVVARGVFDRFTNQFDSISNLKDNASTTPPPPQQTVGTLAAVPSSLTPPALLCLQGASVTNSTLAPRALTTVPPCPSGQLPVYVTPTTTITRHFGGPAGLDELSVGDSLQVTGTFINAQFTASTIEDASIQLVNASVSGVVQSLTTNGNLTDVTIIAATNGGAQAPVAVGSTVVLPLANSTAPNCASPSATQFPCTAVTTSAGTTHGYTAGEITAGQTVAASGVYNLQQHQYLYISSANVTGSVTPPTNQVVKGTLAAAPSQLSAPVLLCLQGAVLSNSAIRPQISVVSPCPGGQLPVAVTPTTTFSRQFSEASALFELSAGDSLTVTGGLVNAQFVAASVQDTSIHLPHLTGTVQSITANGNTTNVVIVVTAFNGGSSVPVGSQAVLPLANAGAPNCAAPSNTQYPCTTVNTGAGTTQGYNLGELTAGQIIQATGVFNDQLNHFLYISSVVTAASTTPPPTPTPGPVTPIRITVRGILTANPSQVTAPVTLCIRSFRLPRNAPAVSSGVCPARQLPVLVTSSTRIVRRFNGASGLDELNRGDSLQIIGELSGGQVTAALVKDESIQAAYTRLVGTVGFVNPSRRHPSFTVRVQSDASGRAPFRVGSVITVDVNSHTQIITGAGTGNNVTMLNPGQTVTVLGVYNRRRHIIIDASRVRVH